jgi:plasmid stabilization system protein ParE
MIFHEGVRDDLRDIYDFIGHDSVDAANRWIDQLLRACAALERTPGMGHRRSDLTQRPLLFWSFRNYTIVYRRVDGSIQVLVIMEGSRDLLRLIQERS